METTRICSKCNVEKPISEFYRDKQKSYGHRPDCKSCNIQKCKEWVSKNKDKRKYNLIKYETGLTKEQFNELFVFQEGVCGICGGEIGERRLCVDHDHNSMLIRGLLCAQCNTGLGFFKDSKEFLSRAIYYLDNNYTTKNIKHRDAKKDCSDR